MKHMTTNTLLLAGITLVAPAFLVAQGMTTTTPPTAEAGKDLKKDKQHKDYRSSIGAMGASTGTAEFRRISKDALKGQTTAKDVIGQVVYGSDGEKLGDISDLTVSSDFEAARMAQAAASADSVAPLSYGSDDTSASTLRSTSSNQPLNTTGSTAGGAVDAATSSLDRAADDTWASAKSMVGLDEPHAIISVGGIMGVGDNLVAVPVSALQFDSAEDRYTLNVTKGEFASIAEGKSVSTTDNPGLLN